MIGIGKNLAPRPTANVWSSGADLDFMFAEDASVVPRAGRAQLQCTRAGDTATRFNAAGQLEVVPANTPRLNHDPSVLRFENRILWSEQITAGPAWGFKDVIVAGVADAAIAPNGTMTADRLCPDTDTGTHYVDQVISGVYSDGETITYSIYLKSVGHDHVQIENFYAIGAGSGKRVRVNLATGTVIAASGTSAAAGVESIVDGWFRVWISNPVDSAATEPNRLLCRIMFLTSGGSGTVTGDGVAGILAWGAQVNSGTLLPYKRTGATPFPKTYACRGLLVEEARKNDIRNNTMVGGGAGVQPTNWNSWVGIVDGVNHTVVGVGVEDGIEYIDIRVQGTRTASVGTSLSAAFEGGNIAATTVGETWTLSAYFALVSGTFGDSDINFRIDERDSSNAGITTQTSSSLKSQITTGKLSAKRLTASFTMAQANVAFVQPRLRIGLAQNVPYDFTVRIGMPQLEKSAFATSVIPTSGAAAIRNADSLTSPLGQWFRTDEGTVVCEFDGPGITTDPLGRVAWALGDSASFNESMYLVRNANTTSVVPAVIDNGASQVSIAMGALGAGPIRTAFAYAANNFGGTNNGAAAVTDASGSVPFTNALALGRASWANSSHLCGHIRRFAYWRTRLPNADLQRLSA